MVRIPSVHLMLNTTITVLLFQQAAHINLSSTKDITNHQWITYINQFHLKSNSNFNEKTPFLQQKQLAEIGVKILIVCVTVKVLILS